MSLYPCAILVSLVPDEHFIALTTTSGQYNRSSRFLINREALAAFVAEDQGHLYDHDLSSFLVLYRSDETKYPQQGTITCSAIELLHLTCRLDSNQRHGICCRISC